MIFEKLIFFLTILLYNPCCVSGQETTKLIGVLETCKGYRTGYNPKEQIIDVYDSKGKLKYEIPTLGYNFSLDSIELGDYYFMYVSAFGEHLKSEIRIGKVPNHRVSLCMNMYFDIRKIESYLKLLEEGEIINIEILDDGILPFTGNFKISKKRGKYYLNSSYKYLKEIKEEKVLNEEELNSIKLLERQLRTLRGEGTSPACPLTRIKFQYRDIEIIKSDGGFKNWFTVPKILLNKSQ